MIKLTERIKHDFLTPMQSAKLLELGNNFSDAKYEIVTNKVSGELYINDVGEKFNPQFYIRLAPTYSLSDMIYKLTEYIGKDQYKNLSFFKDAPFYCFYYENDNKELQSKSEFIAEYPIDSAFELLCWVVENKYSVLIDICK